MNKLSIKACPLCGGSHFKHYMDCKDYAVSGEVFALYECADCGFCFTQFAPVEDEIDVYYASPDYISHSDTRKGLINHLYHYVRRYMLCRKARLVRRALHHKGVRLLDIGAGTGYFVHAMYERGWDVEAVEKSERARSFAKERFQLNLRCEKELINFAPKLFDVITLWHVMEHIEPLNELWKELYRLLDDDGVLVVAVPNANACDAQWYGKFWAAYDVPRHLWHFTPSTMQQFGLKHGFVLEQHHAMPFDAFYIAMMSERYKESAFPFIKGLCAGLRARMTTLGRKGKSSSVIYIFRKKR